MDPGIHQLPLPLALALTIAGAGGGGLGAWSLLAARAVSHPAVHRAVADTTQCAGDLVKVVQQNKAWQGESLFYALCGACIATVLILAFITACLCGGGLAGLAAWSLSRQTSGRAGNNSLTDLDALARQISSGGPLASHAAARALNADHRDVEHWAGEWRRIVAGPRRLGRNGPRQSAQ